MRRLALLAVFILAAAVAQGDELDDLRLDYAMHFFHAEPHLRLAKYVAEHGDPLTGFFISEEAREQHFTREDFARAAQCVYAADVPKHAEPDPAWVEEHPDAIEAWRIRARGIVELAPAAATAVINDALARFPEDAELHVHNAGLLWDQQRLAAAAAEYELAAALAPQSAWIQAHTGRFFLKAMKDRERALRYYLAAYFLDPYVYDTEFAVERIRAIVTDRGTEAFQARVARKERLRDLLEDSDPIVVDLALDEARRNYRPSYAAQVVLLLKRDDPHLRYRAAATLGEWSTRGSEELLRGVLDGTIPPLTEAAVAGMPGLALCMRSALAITAGVFMKSWAVRSLEPLLSHPADLLRFDAASAMHEYGGATGPARLRKLAKEGKIRDARILAMIDAERK